MKLSIHTKNFTVGDRLKGIIEKKVQKIEKYFDGDAECIVVCTKVGNTEKMELTITAHGHAFRAQEENRSMYSNVDVVLGKIERQIVKNKERLQAVVRREAIEEKKFAYVKKSQSFRTAEVVKNKSFDVKSMTNEEAELALATLDHNFFVFANKTNGRINIMYRREDNHVGVIEINNAQIKSK